LVRAVNLAFKKLAHSLLRYHWFFLFYSDPYSWFYYLFFISASILVLVSHY
jgi:hypothetical protein